MGEQIGILILFLVVVLFNLIGTLLQRRKRKERAGEVEERPPAPAGLPPRVVVTRPRPEPAPPPPPAPRRSLATAGPVRRRRRLDLKRPGSLRRAVVLMTVLGPCRALEHEEDGGAARL